VAAERLEAQHRLNAIRQEWAHVARGLDKVNNYFTLQTSQQANEKTLHILIRNDLLYIKTN
jgi:hypothetical protein